MSLSLFQLKTMEQQLEYMKREAVKATSEGLLRLASKGEYFSKLFSDPFQISKMELFVIILKDFQQLTVHAKSSILDPLYTGSGPS